MSSQEYAAITYPDLFVLTQNSKEKNKFTFADEEDRPYIAQSNVSIYSYFTGSC